MPFRLLTIRPSGVVAALIVLVTAGMVAAAPTPKPTPAASVKPTAAPTASPTAAPSASGSVAPTPEVKATYSGPQQKEYIETAITAFVAARQAASQPYLDAHQALDAGGSVNPTGLNSKQAITARRDLIAKCIAANDVYLNFVTTQEDTYRAELSKTPLVPADVDSIVKEFALHSKTAAIVKVREAERATLQCGDEMMASLEKTFGNWSVNGAGKLTFKKNSAMAAYSALGQKYNKLAVEEGILLKDINTAEVVPSASVAPAASVGPLVSPGPAGSASPTGSPKP